MTRSPDIPLDSPGAPADFAPESEARSARPLRALTPAELPDWVGAHPRGGAWAAATEFTAREGAILTLPDASGALEGALFGLGAGGRLAEPLAFGAAPWGLPEGVWRLEGLEKPEELEAAALGWLLGSYKFTRHRPLDRAPARLLAPEGIDAAKIRRLARGAFLARDLINRPANDLGPEALEAEARAVARAGGAEISVILGDELLTADYPLIHAVGRAGPQAPRLVDLRWGDPEAPKVTLVGKGVCFDTGGLDIKPSSNMLLMKKDMGGAAAALSLAQSLMDAKAPIRLRALLPIVENSVGSDAFRPGDVLNSRAGLTVEIGNTDAEGRLILADALTEADSEAPQVLIDFATLTGAARVALGPQLPPLFTDDEALAADLLAAGSALADPLWRLPLWPGYEADLASPVADLNNAPGGGFAGAVTAALFLKRFVKRAGAWAHLDIYGWTPKARPGRPMGGEQQGARAVYGALAKRHGF
ncbi:M17 family metallopeptidase [Neomegalonema sp.]|uniref:leucyl aminopeptidase family protein n=1 Tax=Neomegalonema sp. TaxID=2039713 RepID=UPI002605D610|nr:leucyl aminopeptidase family protein [Neomegalonema sp.]MDD2868039.1 leucyl aminopeptidase family protein [Neomegalonema sp.]